MTGKKQFLYRQILDYLLDYISSKGNKKGCKLPSESELTMKFGGSRISARKAYTDLADRGLIYRVRGSGTYIAGAQISGKNEDKHLEKAGSIALILPDLTNLFCYYIYRGADAFIHSKKTGNLYTLFSEHSPKRETEQINQIVHDGINGIIIFPADKEKFNSTALRLALDGFPLVFIDRHLEGFEISSVSTDHYQMAFQAASYLISKGRKNIGIMQLSSEYATSLKARLRGYGDALTANGKKLKKEYQVLFDKSQDRVALFSAFLKKHPEIDGIITEGDLFGLDLIRSVRNLKMKIPEELSIVFFDNSYLQYQDLLPFKPTSIIQQAEKIGFEAARILVNRINDPGMENINSLLPPELLKGGSA